MYYENLTKQYPIKKTLRNELIPVGMTLENIKTNHIIETDERRKENYKKVKLIFDEYHKVVINTSLENISLKHLKTFSELYFKTKRSDSDNKAMKNEQVALRKEIVAALKQHENFAILAKKEIIQKLDQFVDKEEDHEALSSFSEFFTYLKNYTTIRANLYSDEDKSSTVAYRLINENLPRFLDNMNAYTDIRKVDLQIDNMTEEERDSLFFLETYNLLLTQKGMDKYNEMVGKVNLAVNLYNQQNKISKKMPLLKILYKQILSDRTETFINEFLDDKEVVDNIDTLLSDIKDYLTTETYLQLINELRDSNGNGIYVKNNADLTDFSCIVSDSWQTIPNLISNDYDINYTGRKTGEKYDEEKAKLLKKIDSYEVGRIVQFGLDSSIDKYIERINADVNDINQKSIVFQKIIDKHDASKKLAKNDSAVDAIKDVLDSIKKLACK